VIVIVEGIQVNFRQEVIEMKTVTAINLAIQKTLLI